MGNAVTRAQFQKGDDFTAPEFREKLNQIAGQAADGCSWTFGPGLLGAYSPGTGFTLALDAMVLPTVTRSSFVATITGNTAGAHTWTERSSTGDGAWADKAGGRTSATTGKSAYELNGREGLPTGLQVVMWEVMDTSGEVRYEFDCPIVFFPVKVEKHNGAQGTPSSPAGYTYKVYTVWGTLLQSDVPVERPRDNGRVTYQAGSGGFGVAFYAGATLKLWDAGEKKMTKSC